MTKPVAELLNDVGAKMFALLNFIEGSGGAVLYLSLFVVGVLTAQLLIPYAAAKNDQWGWAAACFIIPFSWVPFSLIHWKVTRVYSAIAAGAYISSFGILVLRSFLFQFFNAPY